MKHSALFRLLVASAALAGFLNLLSLAEHDRILNRIAASEPRPLSGG